jgi:hypothetical protein
MIFWRWAILCLLHCIECVVPVPVAIGVFTTKPPDKVAIIEVEAQ